MATPTALQEHLLRGIQNLALDNERHRTQLVEAGLTADADERWGIGQRSLTNLEQVALAVGVPKAWIDYARAAGQRRTRWQSGQTMLGSGYVERERLIAALGREVRELQDMAGIGAVHIGRGGLDRDVVARFRRVMGMTWQRLGAVSHALALSTEEQHQVWRRGDRHWSSTVATELATTGSKALAEYWNRIVGTDFSAVTIPVVVLQASGITAEDTVAAMPISPDSMVAQVTDALTALDAGEPALPGAAVAIEIAIEAASSNSHQEVAHTDQAPLPDHGTQTLEPDPSPGADR